MAKESLGKGSGFVLEVPLDASSIEGFKPEQEVKVVVRDCRGGLSSETVQLDRGGKGCATLRFSENPGSVRVMVGPSNATDEQMTGLQTLSRDITAGRVRERKLTLEPILISPYYWHWWLLWCRKFTIRGRVVCPDGSAVPGATVCAYDVDWWWWWSSKQKLGCAVTGQDGTFEIHFTWCCGWWPWWWWKYRYWQLEPVLVDRILPVLARDPRLRLPAPSPQPTLEVFESLLPTGEALPSRALQATVDPALLSDLQRRLVDRLPAAREIEHLRLWPWYPWYPWWDCNPDVIFQVTQECEGQQRVLVDESFSDVRPNIPTTLDLTSSPVNNLVATEEACCLGPHDDPVGNCLRIDEACRDLVKFIGGNFDATHTTPKGYLHPQVESRHGDRPFGGVVPIFGVFGHTANVDYYEFEWTQNPADPTSWTPIPPASAGGFRRYYWGPKLGTTDPPGWHPVDFNFEPLDGRFVVESREHFEANNSLLSWVFGLRDWSSATRNYLIRWLTANTVPDGTYHLRVKGWDRVGNQLQNGRILPMCLLEEDNGIVLTIDNRLVTAGPTDPAGHPCGPGFVHLCTDEPDTRIVSVKIVHQDSTETPIAACGKVPITNTDRLEVQFLVHDPDGHLAYYTLDATYGDSQIVPLVHTGAAHELLATHPLLTELGPPASVHGPEYDHATSARSAVKQGAVRPKWYGGTFTFTAPAHLAFPETCCYQLELRAYKRTVVGCDHNFTHWNLSEYSFMIEVDEGP